MCNSAVDSLGSRDVQKYIWENESIDEKDLVLRRKDIHGVPVRLVAQQIAGRRKARHKLPLYYSTVGVVYPPQMNLEQSSSEASAAFKTGYVARVAGGRNLLVDLTGGFGVDSFFFSRSFREVRFVEPDPNLLQIARHNHHVLGATNIFHANESAEKFLNVNDVRPDIFYIDPSRRSSSQQRVHSLRDCQPNITELQSRIFQCAKFLLVKTSPLLDIKAGMTGLPHTKAVIVLAVDNECKEVLYWCEKDFAGVVTIDAINLSGGETQKFTFSFDDERSAEPVYSAPDLYIYEPNAAVLKGGAFKLVGTRFGLSKLEAHTHLYTSSKLEDGFPGRIFSIQGHVHAKEPEVYFPVREANILIRNYPTTVADLTKKLKLREGGEQYLIATSALGKKMLLAAARIK
jgi:hypothetical protein